MLTEEDLKDLFDYIGKIMEAIYKEGTKGDSIPLPPEYEEKLKALRSVQKRLQGVCYFDPFTFQLLLEEDGIDGEKLLLDPDVDNMLLHTNNKDIVTDTIVKWRFERNK